MEVFDWLFSIEKNVVFVVGSNSLKDLRNAINGFLEAQRFILGDHTNYIYPGFQRYVEGVYAVHDATAKGWSTLIIEHAQNETEALETFYALLRDYQETLYE